MSVGLDNDVDLVALRNETVLGGVGEYVASRCPQCPWSPIQAQRQRAFVVQQAHKQVAVWFTDTVLGHGDQVQDAQGFVAHGALAERVAAPDQLLHDGQRVLVVE